MRYIHLALLDEPQQSWEGEAGRNEKIAELRAGGGDRLAFTERPEAADAIVFLESNGYKDRRFIPRLLGNPLIQRFPNRCFTLNYADNPVVFLPGVYASLPRARHRPGWTRAGGYHWGNPNRFLTEFERVDGRPEFLLSFRGAPSHPLRQKLFAQAEAWRRYGPILRVDRWFDHTAAEAREYPEEIVRSHFVLCPRGLGCASHRLFEVMRLGRVPVVIADDWVPPDGPDWPGFSVRLPECDLARIPELLQRRLSEAAAMGRAARTEWEAWYAPGTALVRQLEAILTLAGEPMPRNFAGEWRRWTFRREYGWTLSQRVMQKLMKRSGS